MDKPAVSADDRQRVPSIVNAIYKDAATLSSLVSVLESFWSACRLAVSRIMSPTKLPFKRGNGPALWQIFSHANQHRAAATALGTQIEHK